MNFSAERTRSLPDYSFQNRCKLEVLAHIAKRRSPLLCCPTGGGKTRMACGVIHTLLHRRDGGRPLRVLVLAHRHELVDQWAATLRHHGIEPRGLMPVEKPLALGTIQTAFARLQNPEFRRWLESIDVVVLDECHHAQSPSWNAVVKACRNAVAFGLSATPWAPGGSALGLSKFDSVVQAPSVSELIGLGCLTPAAIYQPRHSIDTRGLSKSGADFNLGELAKRANIEAITRTALQEYGRYCPGQTCMVFTTTVQHAKDVADAFRQDGWAAASIDGGVNREERVRIFKRLENRTLRILVSCELIGEGVDVPVCSAMISLRPTASARLWVQQAGRTLRFSPGKEISTIIDMGRNAVKHGLPEDERRWSLERGVERAERTPRVCPHCRRVDYHAGKCLHCDRTMPPVRQIIVPSEVAGLPKERIMAMEFKKLMRFCHLLTREQVYDVAKIRGYQPGWAMNVIERRERR